MRFVKILSTNSSVQDRPGTSKVNKSSRPKLLRRYTFQEKSANTYAVNNLEYDLAGEVILSPNAMSKFAFQADSEPTSLGALEDPTIIL